MSTRVSKKWPGSRQWPVQTAPIVQVESLDPFSDLLWSQELVTRPDVKPGIKP